MSDTIVVGTVGQGIMRSVDDGVNWSRVGVSQGMHSDAIVRCLALHPQRPEQIYAGTDQGILMTDDAGAHWQRIDSPVNGRTVWAIAVDPVEPNRLLACTGTPTPPALYQSVDSGTSWAQCPATFAENCPAVGVPRPTAIAIDPADHESVWLGVEVDGIRRSRDGGATWQRDVPQITNPDVHNIAISGGSEQQVFVIVNDDIWISADDGDEWRNVDVQAHFPYHYPRGLTIHPEDPRIVFVTVGDTTPGRTGAIMRSRDAGASWEQLPLSAEPNSAMWSLRVSRSDPDSMIAGSRYGHLFRSVNGGDSWTKLARELSEISSIALVPN